MRPSDKQVLIAIAKSHVADNLMHDWVGAVQYLQAKVDAAFPPPRKHMAASVDTIRYMRLDPLDEVAALDVAGDVSVSVDVAVEAGDAGVMPNIIMAWIFTTLTAVLPMPSSVNWDGRDVM